jgi:hypothetical protein
MDEPLERTLADVISFLVQHQISYALIGGIAASLRGEARATADVDLVIAADVDRTLQLLQALEKSSLTPLFSGVEEVVRRAFILPLRHRRTGVKVDLALGMSGFEQQLISRAQTVAIGSHLVRLATAEDLIVMKLLAGRPRDQQDVEGIVLVHGTELDWDYCMTTATELGKAIDQDIASQVAKLRIEYGA